MEHKKMKQTFLAFFLMIVLIFPHTVFAFPVVSDMDGEMLEGTDVPETPVISDAPDALEIPEMSEILEIPEISDIPELSDIPDGSGTPEVPDTSDIWGLSVYNAGQGGVPGGLRGGVMEIVMLDPAPSDIQTAGYITSQEAGIKDTIAPADEKVYYNVISSELDTTQDLTFKMLAGGQGLSNWLKDAQLVDKVTIYDSEQNIVHADVTGRVGSLQYALPEGITLNGNHRKEIFFTCPANILQGSSTYYLVVSESLKTSGGGSSAVLGTKVIFRFTTQEAPEPAVKYYNVTFLGDGASDASGKKMVLGGSDYTFTLKGNPEYIDYTVTATMGKEPITPVYDGTSRNYTISDISGDIEITVAKELKSVDLIYSEYQAGQGSGYLQVYMLDPIPSGIQTAGLVPAKTAGLGKITGEYEEIYYNTISGGFDPTKDITFKFLVAGGGVSNQLQSDAIYNISSIYDSDLEPVNAQASYPDTPPQQETCDAQFTIENDNPQHKKSTSVTYPPNTFESSSVYYLVLSEGFSVDSSADAVMGNKVVFCFSTTEVKGDFFHVSFSGNGQDDVKGVNSVAAGDDYIFTLAGNPEYIDHTVTAVMNGQEVELKRDGTAYLIENVSGDIEITVTKQLKDVRLQYGVYKAGQGSSDLQVYMMDPAPANIRTAGLVPAKIAGVSKIAGEDDEYEEVYYNVIEGGLDPADEITFKVLVAGTGVNYGLHQDAIYNAAAVYDSEWDLVSANAFYPDTAPQTETCDAEFTVTNDAPQHKKSTSVTYPEGTFEDHCTYYLVLSDSFSVSEGKTMEKKVIFCFTTGEQYYNVAFEGSGAADIYGESSAIEKSAYTFTITEEAGYVYTVFVTMDGNEVTDITRSEPDLEGKVDYTVAQVTADLVITVEKTAQEPVEKYHSVAFQGSGAADASGKSQIKEGSGYTFTLIKKKGYDYTVGVTMGGNKVSAILSSETNGTVVYSIAEVTGDITITIDKKTQPDTALLAIGSTLKDSKTKTAYKVTKTGTKKNGSVIGAEVAYTKRSSRTASVTIPNTVTINGIKYKVTSITDNAFKNDKVLTKVKIRSNITTIGKNAFRGCRKLKSVTITKNVTTIKARAFYGCIALNSITIPAKVTKIGRRAFSKCTKLKMITLRSTKLTSKNIGLKAFTGIYKAPTVKVPKKKLAAYKKILPKKGLPKKAVIKKMT